MNKYKELEHKAAGHDGTLTDDEGLLVFKPALTQEIDFYKAVHQLSTASNADDSFSNGDVPLYSWMPTFLGVLDEGTTTTTTESDGAAVPQYVLEDPHMDSTILKQVVEDTDKITLNKKKYIVLENLLHGFKKPNVLDIKLGKILYDENATADKRQRLTMVSNTTTSSTLGFRICGMKIRQNSVTDYLSQDHYENDFNNYVFINKKFGRTRTQKDIKDAFKLYFGADTLSKERISSLLTIFLQRLQLFYNTLLNQEIRMISSSLLFIYETDSDRWDILNNEDSMLRDNFLQSDDDDDDDDDDDEYEGEDNEVLTAKNSRLKHSQLSSMSLIDFAHSKFTPGQGYDENVIEGVESLIQKFKDLIEDHNGTL
ncbi:inositol polyphosphate multikinase NDAI_0A01200 [Naumovozyma dairenensis CBS 421]|uniref:Kinase n=1 Tax=Naumovozyma dairenensis (strain ATCC 10597 / BCRC 20456 / CBS 421 / NBRC 0211 / NRRL Y-12639) TaxID=1071378 RepID=G0W390_NAUDC|nr:hypothetical protein NDAI_0A01200 [Naumovozyma dairenensis CBS 421]CCD22278.1 hypothetical protein NDAI_0A01200 [Naumovozyma dairenensis CBS 421]